MTKTEPVSVGQRIRIKSKQFNTCDGVVFSIPRNQEMLRVVLDGRKRPFYIHKSFLKKLVDAPESATTK